MGLQVFLAKEKQKFSAAHMTILGKDRKERIHGHNYQVELIVEYREPSTWLPFSIFKETLRNRCEQWDEYLLLPELAPEFSGEEQGDSFSFQLCGKHYVIPKEEIVLLPVRNITSESLAKLLCERVWSDLQSQHSLFSWMEIVVSETPGQGASYTIR